MEDINKKLLADLEEIRKAADARNAEAMKIAEKHNRFFNKFLKSIIKR